MKLGADGILELTHIVTRRVNFIHEQQISTHNWIEAEKLTAVVDCDDTVFVALALELKCALWTGDKKLQREISGIEILSTDLVGEMVKL